MRRLKSILGFMVMAALSMAFLSSCTKDEDPEEYNRVLIFYSNGFNSLSEYLREDLDDFKTGYIPSRRSGDVILIISKLTTSRADYGTKVSPYLLRLVKDSEGQPAVETVMSLSEDTILADSETLNTFLRKIKESFPAKSYGMVMSSHATGWLPCYYFANPSKYDRPASLYRRGKDGTMDKRQPYVEPERDPSLPAVKSFTQETEEDGGIFYSHEIDLKDFANAIPMHMDYILFDACLMGGIEVAYQLKDIADRIGFSQTEVLADGYDYASLSKHILQENNPQAVCEEFFESYDARSGENRSATISYIDCSGLDNLASVCSDLFEKYRVQIASVKPSAVQKYFYNDSYHWHFDLYDIVEKAGAGDEDLARLQNALDKCVLYNAATPSFFSLKINTHCGFSMYLPADGSAYLNDYYKTLSWNQATSLVR